MVKSLRVPLFVIALILIVLIVLVETISPAILDAVPYFDDGTDLPAPGRGIRYLALLDGLVLLSIGLIAVALLIRGRVQGRTQGITTFVVALLVLLGAFTLIVEAIQLLITMVKLITSVPFGTIKYFEKYADFDTKTARVTLSVLMLLKLYFAGFLVFSQQRFLQNKGLVLIILSSLIANIIVSFLHGLVPRYLVSVTDGIAAIVVGMLAAIWALILLVGSFPSILRAVRIDRSLKRSA